MVSFAVFLLILFFGYYFFRIMASGIPSYRPDDVNYMDKLLVNQGYTSFKCVYYYASTAIAFNETEDKIFIKGTVGNEQQRNNNNAIISSNAEGIYSPPNFSVS